MDLVNIIDVVLNPWRKPPSSSRGAIALGAWGESYAARVLRRRGVKILYRNYRAPQGGEIDLVGREKGTLLFIEVKTRRLEKNFSPRDSINRKKENLIKRGALSWLQLLGFPDIPFRFDVVEIILSQPIEFRWNQDAFSLPPSLHY